jgi:hypothetical protein
MNPMNNALAVLCVFAARHLPDSLRERQAVLRALAVVVRHDHPVHRDVRAQLAALAALEKLNAQMEARLANSTQFNSIQPRLEP